MCCAAWEMSANLHDTCFFFFNDTATTEIYTLSLHDALPICQGRPGAAHAPVPHLLRTSSKTFWLCEISTTLPSGSFSAQIDRKSTRLNSSHANISYAVFCLKKKKV